MTGIVPQAGSSSNPANSKMFGVLDNGSNVELSATPEGHLEAAIHSPRLPFGSVHSESIIPIFQADGVYGINATNQLATVSGSGAATTENGSFKISTGTTIYSQAVLQSRKRLRYRPGQGTILRFAGFFSSPVNSSYQVIGQGHSEDGYFFGYKNTVFGIIHNKRGLREVQTLTVTTGATASGNVTVTLDSVAFTIPVTNASNIYRTAYEIASYTGYTGWKAEPNGATVVFLADSVGNKTGTFSFGAAATGAVASISETRAGAAVTETFIPQSSWNGDIMDGSRSSSNPSGVALNPQMGNVYQIGMQYLGYGSVIFSIECNLTGNNPEFVVVHTIRNPNTLTDTHVSNPSMPFTMAVYSAGSTTNMSIKVGSFAAFVEGAKVLHGNRYSYFNQLTTVGSTNYQALFSVMNTRYFKGKANQSVINIISASGALKHTSPCIFYLIRGGALSGNPNFTQYATDSCSYYDNAATTVAVTSNDQIVWSGHLGDTGEFDHHFGNGSYNVEEFTLQPGEWMTLAAKSTTGTPAYVTGSINTREDQ